MKFLSSGGAGDLFISLLKIEEYRKEYDLMTNKFQHTHIESFDMSSAHKDICSIFQAGFIERTFEVDPNYIQNYRAGKWSGFIAISSGIDSVCRLKGETNIKLKDPFYHMRLLNAELRLYKDITPNKYDYCIQAAAGMKNDRMWRFNPLTLASVLRGKGKKVAIVGNAKLYEDENDVDNFVNKISLRETFFKIFESKEFIGLSGLLTFVSMYSKIPTIHFQIDEEHNRRYIHPLCEPYVKHVQYGSLSEITKLVNI